MYAKLKKKKSVKTHKNTEGARGMIVERNIKEVWNMKNRWANDVWFSWSEEAGTQVLSLHATIQNQNG